MERVPHRATLSDRDLGGGAGRPDSLPVLTLLIGWAALMLRVFALMLRVFDAILAFVTVSVVVSGLFDWNRGARLLLPVLPQPFDRWHLLSSAALVVYLVIHVSRRWGRLRRPTIR